MLDSSTSLDLFDFRYGANGTVLYREGSVSPAESIKNEDANDGEKAERLGMHCIETESKFFEELIADSSPLKKIAGKSISKLAREFPGLLVFPDRPEELEEDIQRDYILELDSPGEYLRISTKNLIGFIGYGDLKINIHSRFEEHKFGKEGSTITDFFLIYMLEKIARLNLFDLPSPARDDISVFDLLPYLFPKYLEKALSQGMYKEYVHHTHNDANIKGTIDVSRHIRSNTPFLGKVAYNTREFSFDNPVTQLVRHTIEHLKNNSSVSEKIISSPSVHDLVVQIVNATPSYSKAEREKVIRNNLKPFCHPYYNEYGPLQKLCLAILRYDRLSYGTSDNEVHGVIFDIAALWEEYLAVVMQDCDITHPNNRTGEFPVYLFKGDGYKRFPDFYRNDMSCVMDAKYKRLADHGDRIDRDDIHQLISYMYILGAKAGTIICPTTSSGQRGLQHVGTLNGYLGNVYLYYLLVPESLDYDGFRADMKKEEEKICETIKSPLEKYVTLLK